VTTALYEFSIVITTIIITVKKTKLRTSDIEDEKLQWHVTQ